MKQGNLRGANSASRILTGRSLRGRGFGFGAHAGRASEIPILVIDADRSHILGRKRDFFVTTDFNKTAFTGDDLIKGSAIPELHGDYLIAYACFSSSFQEIDKTAGNRN
jgi:hypothetical protein